MRDDAHIDQLRSATRGEYEILHEVGRGGMAVVYVAQEPQLGRRVALKVLLPELANADGMAERFLLEARTAAQLEHANIVPVYAAHQRADLSYFTMKFVDGVSLEQFLRDKGPLPVSVAAFLLTQIAEALQYAHEQGVTHRDVKPANVMIDVRGHAMLTDFGIARVAHRSRLTQSGFVIGTPSHMSPEQIHGGDAGPAADQYSLGVLAYQMLCGRTPFTGSALELFSAHLSQVPRALSEVRPDCPPSLARAIMRMLEKTPEARWPSLESLLLELSQNQPTETTGCRRQLATLLAGAVSGEPFQLPACAPLTSAPAPVPQPRGIAASQSGIHVPRSLQGLLRRRLAIVATSAFLCLAGVGVASTPYFEVRDVCASRGSGECAVVMPPPPPVREDTATRPVDAEPRFALDVDSVRVTVGDTLPLTANRTVAPDDTTFKRITWHSSRPAVVSVSAHGVLTAHAPSGPVQVIAISGTDTSRVRVWVDPKPVARVRLEILADSVTVGDTVGVRASALARDGDDLPNVEIRLSVRGSGIAEVVGNDRLLGIAPGIATVTATAGGVTTRVRVTIVPRPIPALDTERVTNDIHALVAAISARDTAQLARVYPAHQHDAERRALTEWLQGARRLTAQLVGPPRIAIPAGDSVRVAFTVLLRWRAGLRRSQKSVAFEAHYAYADGWRLELVKPTSVLP